MTQITINTEFEYGFKKAHLIFKGTQEEFIHWFRTGKIPGAVYLWPYEEKTQRFGPLPLENPEFYESSDLRVRMIWNEFSENSSGYAHIHEPDDSYIALNNTVYPFIE